MKKLFLIVFIINTIGLGVTAVFSANHCVRQGANGNGSDWANAYGQLPTVLVRGDTYYIADGNYGAYNFDDPVSGSRYIYIKKATQADHGTGTGWQASFGDGQAVFVSSGSTTWQISSSFYNIDGMVGQGKANYGFKVITTTTGSQRIITIAARMGNLVFKHIESHHHHNSDKTITGTVLDASSGFVHDVLVAQCWFHDTSYRANIMMRNTNNFVFENNYFSEVFNKELISDYYSENVVIRNNYIENIAGTGIFIFRDVNNWSIYNNLFFWNDPKYGCNNWWIGTWSHDETGSNNVEIFNNTFTGYRGLAMGFGFSAGGTGNQIYNNLFYDNHANSFRYGGGIDHDYNWYYGHWRTDRTPWISLDAGIIASESHSQLGTGNPFVNSSNNGFSLAQPTNPAKNLGFPYNTDLYGNIRGADGVWDRGAFEYNSVSIGKFKIQPFDYAQGDKNKCKMHNGMGIPNPVRAGAPELKEGIEQGNLELLDMSGKKVSLDIIKGNSLYLIKATHGREVRQVLVVQ